MIRLARRDDDAAIADLDQAIKASVIPEPSGMLYLRALGHLAAGHDDQALADCDFLASSAPGKLRYQRLRKFLLLRLRRAAEARRIFDEWIERNPAD